MRSTRLLLIAVLFGLCALLPASAVLAADVSASLGKRDVWPADKLPADLPPYDGKVANWGQTAPDELMIIVRDTGKEALDAYLAKLQANGWQVSKGNLESRAVKGAHDVSLTGHGRGGVQITVRTAKTGVWPADAMPPALPQPAGCVLLDPQLSPNGDDAWLYNFTCRGMSEAQAHAYMDGLKKNGWTGGYDQMTIETAWRNAPYGMMLEIYEFSGGNASFTVNFGKLQ